MARTSTKVFVLEVMGRHAGWIAAAGGLIEDHGIPVVDPVSRDRVRREEVHRPRRRAGEGARLLHRRRLRGRAPRRRHASSPSRARRTPSATPSSAAPRRWSRTWSRSALGHKFHWAVADYLQRAARHIASKTDVQAGLRARQARGRAGAEGPQRGDADDRARLRRAVPLEDRRRRPGRRRQRREVHAARLHQRRRLRHHREVPPLPAPLIAGEDYPAYRNGLPVYATLKNVAVPRKLAEFAMK